MDTLTHALVGAVTARATAPKELSNIHLPLRSRTLVGGLAAAFPDIDYLTIWIDPLSFIADWHRAITHSFVMLPIWALALGFLFASLTRRRAQLRELVIVCALGIFTHILTDLITSWGTQIFAPFSQFAPALSLTFIIDPYFTAIVAGALVLSVLKQSRLLARTGLVVLVCYVGSQAVLKLQATSIGREYVDTGGLQPATVYAMPQPFSPFNWKLIVTTGKHYHMAYVNLLAREPKPVPGESPASLWSMTAYYRPPRALDWKQYSLYGTEAITQTIWARPEFERYRRFARYPALYRIDKNQSNRCVWFMDLRFALPTLFTPFRYGMCRQGRADWKLYQLKRLTETSVRH